MSNQVGTPYLDPTITVPSRSVVRWVWVLTKKSGVKLYLPCESGNEVDNTINGLESAIDEYKNKGYNGHSYQMYGMGDSRMVVVLSEVQAYGALPIGENPGAWH